MLKLYDGTPYSFYMYSVEFRISINRGSLLYDFLSGRPEKISGDYGKCLKWFDCDFSNYRSLPRPWHGERPSCSINNTSPYSEKGFNMYDTRSLNNDFIIVQYETVVEMQKENSIWVIRVINGSSIHNYWNLEELAELKYMRRLNERGYKGFVPKFVKKKGVYID